MQVKAVPGPGSSRPPHMGGGAARCQGCQRGRRWTVLGRSDALPQRFEYKYLIAERQAQLVQAFASAYLRPDIHTDAAHDNQYTVYTLYLDSRDLALYHSTVSGDKNRFKLRVRCYDDRPDTLAFFEIKSRKSDVIQKARAPVHKEAIERIIGTLWAGRRGPTLGSWSVSVGCARACRRGPWRSFATPARRTWTPTPGRCV